MTDLDKLTRPALNVLVRKSLADAQRQGSRADANLRDFNSASEERDAALARIAKVKEVVEAEKHWNEGCGWDVPAGAVLRALTEGENE